MTFSDIKKLKVYTKTGKYLGKIIDVKIDPRSHQIISYMVKCKWDIKNLFKGCLLINYKQVVSLSDQKMVVEDMNLRKGSQNPKPAKF